jgi:methylated-DNA-protein-cysteine methyltransferase-like protein
MVGWALNNCHHLEEFIPAHRVVNRNGMLSGKHHFGGQSIMQQLLESEGIEIAEDCIINFDKLFWDPSVELKEI